MSTEGQNYTLPDDWPASCPEIAPLCGDEGHEHHHHNDHDHSHDDHNHDQNHDHEEHSHQFKHDHEMHEHEDDHKHKDHEHKGEHNGHGHGFGAEGVDDEVDEGGWEEEGVEGGVGGGRFAAAAARVWSWLTSSK